MNRPHVPHPPAPALETLLSVMRYKEGVQDQMTLRGVGMPAAMELVRFAQPQHNTDNTDKKGKKS